MTNWSTEDRRRYWTVREVAEYWRVSDDKVRASLKKGSLAHYIVDGAIRIREQDALGYGRPVHVT
jgi:excisionase family DNA binding protein